MPKLVLLSTVRDERKHEAAKKLRSDLFKAARDMVGQAGDNLGGYALVVWDESGATGSKYRCEADVISRRFVPLHVANALNQHIGADLVDVGDISLSPLPDGA